MTTLQRRQKNCEDRHPNAVGSVLGWSDGTPTRLRSWAAPGRHFYAAPALAPPVRASAPPAWALPPSRGTHLGRARWRCQRRNDKSTETTRSRSVEVLGRVDTLGPGVLSMSPVSCCMQAMFWSAPPPTAAQPPPCRPSLPQPQVPPHAALFPRSPPTLLRELTPSPPLAVPRFLQHPLPRPALVAASEAVNSGHTLPSLGEPNRP